MKKNCSQMKTKIPQSSIQGRQNINHDAKFKSVSSLNKLKIENEKFYTFTENKM